MLIASECVMTFVHARERSHLLSDQTLFSKPTVESMVVQDSSKEQEMPDMTGMTCKRSWNSSWFLEFLKLVRIVKTFGHIMKLDYRSKTASSTVCYLPSMSKIFYTGKSPGHIIHYGAAWNWLNVILRYIWQSKYCSQFFGGVIVRTALASKSSLSYS